MEEESELEKEQDVMNQQDGIIENLILILRLRVLLADNNNHTDEGTGTRTVEKRLKRLRTSLQEDKGMLSTLDGSPKRSLSPSNTLLNSYLTMRVFGTSKKSCYGWTWKTIMNL